MVKNLPANTGNARDRVQSLDREDPLEKEMATCVGEGDFKQENFLLPHTLYISAGSC